MKLGSRGVGGEDLGRVGEEKTVIRTYSTKRIAFNICILYIY